MWDCFMLTARITLHMAVYNQFECQNGILTRTLLLSLSLVRLTYNCLLFMILCLYFIKWIPPLLSSIYIPTTAAAATTTILQSHSLVFCLLVRAYTAAAFACGRLSLYRPPCTGTHTHRERDSDVAFRISKLFSTYTHINTHAWMLLFFVCLTIRFSLSLSCFGLCMALCVCVRLMYINTISGPLAYNKLHHTEPYTTQHCERI